MEAFRSDQRHSNCTSETDFDLGAARAAARAWATRTSVRSRIEHAAGFARVALEAYAAATVPALRFSAFRDEPPVRLASDGMALAGRIGKGASSLPLVQALHQLTSLYPALLPQEYRSATGVFYTPPCLVARLLDLATEATFDWQKGRVLDPAVGAGAFLVQAALRLRDGLGKADPAFVLAQIGTRLSGLELDANAARLAQAALEIALSDLVLASGRGVPPVVQVCDALEESPVPGFDLVVGNPPFGRITLTTAHRERFRRGLYGHANLYGVFTDVALRWTRPGGFVAYLTPTSLLSGRYFSALRHLLAREAPPVALDFIHARKGVFEDVLQETMLALYRKARPAGRAQIHYLHVASEHEARVVRNGTIGIPRDPAGPWLAPRSPEHSQLIARVETMPARLRDWGYSVSTGPLVWNRFKPQLCRTPSGRGVYPLIWAECVASDGRFVFRALKKNHSPFFRLDRGDDWLLVDRPCVLVQRTTAKEQPRRLIAAELPAAFVERHGGVVVENHLNMVRATRDTHIAPGVVAALLNSRVLDQVFRCMNGSVAVSASELEALPLPDAGDLVRLSSLVAEGAGRKQIELECDRLYNNTV